MEGDVEDLSVHGAPAVQWCVVSSSQGGAVYKPPTLFLSNRYLNARWIGLSEDDAKKNAASPPNINIALGDRDPPFIKRRF
jgi:hypothetical protein